MKYFYIFILIPFLSSCHKIPQQAYKGYPSKEGAIDIKEYFQHPPKGYGNVPFYWWNGDSLKRERLLEQLDILSDASTDGFAVSYIHTHPKVDIEQNAQGYGSFGRADGGIPEVFSEEWWKLWNWFSGACAERGIGLGVDDYVIGWAGNGYYVDELCADSSFAHYQGRLKADIHTVKPGDELTVELPEHVLTVTTYPDKINLASNITNQRLHWKSDTDKTQKVYILSTTPSYELHPEYGKRLVDVYFNRFWEKMDYKGRKGINYFFQDELHYALNIHSWCEDMTSEFKKRKGYDILPYLPALFEPIGDITPKIRLDYSEVVTQLAEERYFKPVFDWHKERNLIYGCDNNGRGLQPLEYMDYFRSISWFTAPGNDAPARGSSFRQTKVSSSVAHLYQRPRTWLEAFHSMGWDSNGEWLTSQLDHHLIAGGNLLCMHGLYYSTHGGWWEWAPPCFHFRMPYWPHMKEWLKYAERMCFVLSQGVHVCDIAVLYPTETLQAYPNSNIRSLWQLTDTLTHKGWDYDFIDYQSLQRADISDGEISIANEKYKILILAETEALHHETLVKINQFHQNGGTVIALGSLPKASSKSGENDKETDALTQDIFFTDTKGLHTTDCQQVISYIQSHFTPDFKTSHGTGKVLHRKIGKRDLYMVLHIENGSEIFFRSKGKVECWNAQDGSIKEQPILRQDAEGTWIAYDGEYNNSRLYVFSEGEPFYQKEKGSQAIHEEIIPITGNWQTEIIPTMNNRWGDYRLPASDEIIGVEAREFAYQFITNQADTSSFKNIPTDVYGYAPYFKTITLNASTDLKTFLQQNHSTDHWQPYVYSWQYGVFDNPGSQGYHGLKGKVDNCFLILDQGGHQLFTTHVYAPEDGQYRLEQEGVTPTYLMIDQHQIKDSIISLSKGWHHLLLAYENTKIGKYMLNEKKSNSIDNRNRSAVVLYPTKFPTPQKRHPYDNIVATKWYNTPHLAYDIRGGQQGIYTYRFQTAPGTETLHFKVNGKIHQVWIDGEKVEPIHSDTSKGIYTYQPKDHRLNENTVIVNATPHIGQIGPAFFTEPVKITCGKGEMPLGNWSDRGAMKYYSGGVLYQKEIDIPNFTPSIYLLDLGKVDATCEIIINGQRAGIIMSPPYRIDISHYMKSGTNSVEVLVYSTLSNHYQTIPSAYRGKPQAGLYGPVNLIRKANSTK